MNAVIDHEGQLVSGHAESSVTRESEGIYRLTPLGLIRNYAMSDESALDIVNAIELYMRRNGLGMAVANNRLAFVEMEPVEGDK